MVSLRSHGRIRLGDPLTASVAGAEANVAIGLARLGHEVAFAGVVGDDELGELVLRTLRAEGVDVRHLRRDASRPTGVMFREQRTGAVVDVTYVRRGSAGSTVDAALVQSALVDRPDVVHVSGVTAAVSGSGPAAVAAALAGARRVGALACFDVNFRSRLWARAHAAATLSPLLGDVDLLVASADEVPLMLPGGAPPRTGETVETVVTHGADGAEAWLGRRHEKRPAVLVDAVDVVGAGDAFVAGYLSARLDGLGLGERLERGVAVAGVAVSSAGDWEGLPTRAELDRFGTDHGGALR
jgi:2-dehydro-3-deoxygluconokinase